MYSDVNILNVGAGSCIVIESPSGRKSMIDINDGGDLREAASMDTLTRLLMGEAIRKAKEKLVDPIAWCNTNGIHELWRFILTHPDADHMAGLRRILARELPATVFWDIPHKRKRTKRDEFTNDAAFADWQMYEKLRKGTLENAPQLIRPLRGDKHHYWIDDDIEILSPTLDLLSPCDSNDEYNNGSYVLRVHHGPTTIVLPGDIEETGWRDMLNAGIDLSSDVLVASHHGRQSGYFKEAVEAIEPAIVVISTAKLDPKHDAEDEYRKHTSEVYSTRKYGTMWLRMFDDGSFELYSHEQQAPLTRWTRTASAA